MCAIENAEGWGHLKGSHLRKFSSKRINAAKFIVEQFECQGEVKGSNLNEIEIRKQTVALFLFHHAS
jgi:hypothetical protein